VLTLAVGAVVRRAVEYAADPVGDKDCLPLAPGGADAVAPRPAAVAPDTLPWSQRGGTINDASCLNRTPVYGIVRVREEDDVRTALRFAREHGLWVSVTGVRHSMGGQAFAPGAVVLDMTGFNRLRLDAEARTLTAQSGATWHDIQELLHPRFAVKAMQSTDIFTVGGSIAVNAHGMDHAAGSVGRTLRAMRVMLADGSVVRASRAEHAELFRLVLGGYGLFGVILDAELEVTDNVVYRSERRLLDYREFPGVFARELQPDPAVGLMYGHLSTARRSLLREMLLYSYRRTDAAGATIPPLAELGGIKLRRLVFNLAKLGALPMEAKWWAEKYLEPRLESCPVSRAQAQAQGEACLVPRNQPMHDSVRYLKNGLTGETDILHEYFVPRDRFVPFVDGLRDVVRASQATLLNASVRIVHAEDAVLTYAPADMFAIVLYVNQTVDAPGHARMHRLTGELIDLAARHGGTFFLPYQLHYTAEQLARAYPRIGDFFAAKRRWDPHGLFTNTFHDRYAAALGGADRPGRQARAGLPAGLTALM
jgi:FAD/FMN-containing dehydrogenase